MPYIIMALCAAIAVAAFVLPVKWILETKVASKAEKTVFILLAIPLSIFSYYLFLAYLHNFKGR